MRARILLTLALTILFGAFARSAHAGDGVAEINQTCALNTGCFAGDTAGYPITITTTGSYRLTSDLNNTGPSHIIEVTADGVSIDLNGFEMAGSVTCTGEGLVVSCVGPPFKAIEAFAHTRLRVQNGRIRNIAAFSLMIGAGDRTLIRNVVASSGGGVLGLSAGSIVLESTAYQTTGNGFAIGQGSVVMGCTSSSNLFDGFEEAFGGGSSLVGNAADANGREGFSSGKGSVLSGNSAYQNERAGIRTELGALVSDSSAYQNGSHGIFAFSGSALQRNTTRLNAGFGIGFNGPSAYRENTANENTLGQIIPSFSSPDMGGNSCGGTATCP